MATLFLNKLSNAFTDPILYSNRHFVFVKFGLFSSISSFIISSLFLTYLRSKGWIFGTGIIFWYTFALFLSLVCSKLLHPLVIGQNFFNDPKKYLRQTAFYNQGAQIGIILGMLIMSVGLQVNPLLLLDAICYSSCLALVVGRIGCYNYGCCYGRPTHSRFAIRYTNPNTKILRVQPELYNIKLIPIQLISAAYDLLLFIGLTILYFMQPQDGILCITFGVCYNLFRILTQKYRGNEIDQKSTREEKVFVVLSHALVVLSVMIPLVVYFYYRHLPLTPIVTPLSIGLYLKTIFLNVSYFITIMLSAIICFIVHGYHKKLGEHV